MSFLRWLLWLWYSLTRQEAVRLNAGWAPTEDAHHPIFDNGYFWRLWAPLLNGGTPMAKIGDKFRVFVAPTNAAGGPAPVFDLRFDESGAQYEFDDSDGDGLSAVFVAAVSGAEAVVTITAKSKSGADLSATVILPAVEAPPVDEEAVALNAGFEAVV